MNIKRCRLPILVLVSLTVLSISMPFARGIDNGQYDMHLGTPLGDAESTPIGTGPGGGAGSDSNKDPNNTRDRDNPEGQEGEPVSLYSGQFMTEVVDVRIPGRMPLQVRRLYRSGSTYQGMFGMGWTMEYNERLFLMSDGSLILRRDNSSRDAFTVSGADTFVGPAGCYDTIRRNPDGTYLLREKHGRTFLYDVNGCLARIEDRHGNQVLLTYDSAGPLPINAVSRFSHSTTPIMVAMDYRLTRMEIAFRGTLSGRFIAFEYNADGRVSRVSDFAGRAWTYTYDPAGHGTLLSMTTPAVAGYPVGLTMSYAYTTDNQLLSIADPAGRTYLANTYDAQWRILSQAWGTAQFGFAYPSNSPSLRMFTNANGCAVNRTFDTKGNVLSRVVYTKGLRLSDPPAYTNTWTYDTASQITKHVYPAGNAEGFTYDSAGNTLTERRKATSGGDSAADLVSTYTYEPRFNMVKTLTDPNGNTTTYTYDYENVAYGTTNGNLMRISFPQVGGVTSMISFTYNAYDQLETLTDAGGTSRRFAYDAATGDLLQRIDGFGTALAATNTFLRDPRGNVLSETDPLGRTTTFQYDPLDRLTQITAPAPLGYVTKYTYTCNGKVSSIARQTSDAGHPWQSTKYDYDVLDRLITVTDDLGHQTRYEYDGEGNRTKVADANSNATLYAYDERNLLWKVTDALSNVTQYVYDRNGNLAILADAKTNLTRYVWDAYDRMVTNTYADLSAESFAFDKAGSLTSRLTRASQTITYARDSLKRISHKQYPDGTGINYVFDAAGRLTRVTDTSGVLTFTYDALSRLTVTTNTFGKVVAYEYDRAGNRAKLIYPDNTFVTYGYDVLNRLTNIWAGGTSTVAQFAYDSLNRRTQLDLGNGTRALYGHDWANNLTNLLHCIPATGSNLSQFAYTYDNAGNRLTLRTAYVTYPGTHVYTYAKNCQLTSAAYPAGYLFPNEALNYDSLGNRTTVVTTNIITYAANNLNQFTSVGGVTYAYDFNGNLISNGDLTFGYDPQNRLISAVRPGTSTVFKLDAFGHRIEKSVNGAVLRLTYSGNKVVAEYDDSGAFLRKYVFGTGVDEPLRMDAGTNHFYYYADGLGSVSYITDDVGTKVESYTYTVFGNPGIPASVTKNRYLFTGREYDAETGVFYYRARNYVSGTGRFIQPDPLGYIDTPNLYTYCCNNPVNRVDPLGLFGNGPATPIGKGCKPDLRPPYPPGQLSPLEPTYDPNYKPNAPPPTEPSIHNPYPPDPTALTLQDVVDWYNNIPSPASDWPEWIETLHDWGADPERNNRPLFDPYRGPSAPEREPFRPPPLRLPMR